MLRATFTRFWSRQHRLPTSLSFCYTTTTSTSRPLDSGIHPTVLNASQLVRSDGQKQTIYALSTPPGKGGVAVIRVSGPEALEVWRRMVRPLRTKPQPAPWKLERCKIVDPEEPNEVLDDGLSVFFQGRPRIFSMGRTRLSSYPPPP
jgi:tRNA modification GTPase